MVWDEFINGDLIAGVGVGGGGGLQAVQEKCLADAI